MQFGNWIVTGDSVKWNGNSSQRFEIPGGKLNATRAGESGQFQLYDWIVQATEKDWLTENDLYDLNFAFVYAVAKFKLDFNYDFFDATLAYQFEIFESEDEEE
ncbi:MAG TPA: hypothetical protein VFN95_03900 [Flavitalea sp.]|nr:hypothetical protein [Flavitalea sp.]